MAQRVITQLVSDLSGTELSQGEGRSVEFGYDGKSYRIDLTDKEAEAFAKAISKYVESATRVTSSRRTPAKAAPGEDLRAVREWAQANGFQVSQRGRIAAEVLRAYEAAH